MKKKLRGKTQGMKQAVGSRPEAAKIKPGVPVSSESTGSQKIPSTSQPFPEEVTLKTTKDEAGPTEGASGAVMPMQAGSWSISRDHLQETLVPVNLRLVPTRA